MIKFLLVVTTMFVSGYDTKVSEVTDIDKCVADAPAVLQGVELTRNVRAAKVECVERTREEETAQWKEDVKISLASKDWVEPDEKAKSASRFNDEGSYPNYGAYPNYGRYPNYGYDSYGYDPYGYDRWGYDRWGYDRWGYDRWGYDRWGQRRWSQGWYGNPVPDWANPWSANDLCGAYPGHPACRQYNYGGGPRWNGAPSRPVPNQAYPVPNPAQPMNH